MRFRSKVDTWLLIVVLAASLLALAGAATAFQSGAGLASVALLVVAGVGLPLWILASTTYTVEAGVLLVRSGPFRWHISAAEINRISASRSLLSSPALSLDRLLIEYGSKKSLLVSPVQKEEFLRALQAEQSAA